MNRLAAAQEALLRALARHGVDLVVVGGVAAQLHGWRGATVDLDIAVSIDESNVRRLNRALVEVGAGPGLPGALGTVFSTTYGRLEIVRVAEGIGDYAAWSLHAAAHDLGDGLTVVVADPDDVLRSKEAAGRDKDRAALPQMRRDFVAEGTLQLDAVRGPIAAAPQPGSGPPAFMVTLLGPRPDDRAAARVWDGAAQLVLDFRSRWKVTSSADPLGPADPGGHQTRDRRHLERALRRAQLLLARGA